MDIHKFKHRLEKAEKRIKESNIGDKNKKTIFDFERQLFLDELSYGRIESYLSILRLICENLNKDLDSLVKVDIQMVLEWMHRNDLSPNTKRNYKVCFKKFLKLTGKTDLADAIHVKAVEQKIPDIFSRKEVIAMIETAWHPMDKALIAALYETGCRIGEMATLQIKSIHFDIYGAILIVNGKTGMRRVRAIFSAPYLSTWLDQHPDKLNPEAPFWIVVDHTKKSFGQLASYDGLNKRLKRIAKRAGIKKRVYNHLFRHTSATEKSGILTDSMMDEYFGWVQGSGMTRIYVHRSGKNLDDTLLKAHGIVKDNTPPDKDLAPIQCPRCGTVNGTTGKFCYKCGASLDLITAINVDKEKVSLTIELMDLIRQEPAILELIKSRMESRKTGT